MPSLPDSFAAEHRRCDAAFIRAEELLIAGSPLAIARFRDFRRCLAQHCAVEEGAIFPAFEADSSLSHPTAVLRKEHMQILALCDEVLHALAGERRRQAAGLADSLYLLLQSHFIREERILFPLYDEGPLSVPRPLQDPAAA